MAILSHQIVHGLPLQVVWRCGSLAARSPFLLLLDVVAIRDLRRQGLQVDCGCEEGIL